MTKLHKIWQDDAERFVSNALENTAKISLREYFLPHPADQACRDLRILDDKFL